MEIDGECRQKKLTKQCIVFLAIVNTYVVWAYRGTNRMDTKGISSRLILKLSYGCNHNPMSQ
jgi:hypothetical protein